jgi:hypothetical protein
MTNSVKRPGRIPRRHLQAANAALTLAVTLVFGVVTTQSAQAQTYTVIHNFTGGQDGEHPYAGLTMDRAGSLYGTTNGGDASFGTVFNLKHTSGGWVVTPLHNFRGGSDGAFPLAGVIFDPHGGLYGTTESGGSSSAGTFFALRTVCTTPWCVLYRFKGGGDGDGPNLW